MNTIINELFAAYLDSKLAVRPHIPTDEEDEELVAVERRCAQTKEDLRFLENYILKYGHAHEQRGFCAGFRAAFDLLTEILSLEGALD